MNAVTQAIPQQAAVQNAAKPAAANPAKGGFAGILALFMNQPAGQEVEEASQAALPEEQAEQTEELLLMEPWLLGLEQLAALQPPTREQAENPGQAAAEAAVNLTAPGGPMHQTALPQVPDLLTQDNPLLQMNEPAAVLTPGQVVAAAAETETAPLNIPAAESIPLTNPAVQNTVSGQPGQTAAAIPADSASAEQMAAKDESIFSRVKQEATLMDNPADTVEVQENTPEQEAAQFANNLRLTRNGASSGQRGAQEQGGEAENSFRLEALREDSAASGKQEAAFQQILQQNGLKDTVNPAEKLLKVPAAQLPEELPQIIKARLQRSEGGKGGQDLIIQLEPKALGKMTVQLTSHDGIVAVKILVEHAESKVLLDSQIPALKQSFSEQGVKYGQVNVEVGGQFAGGETYQHKQSWQTGESAQQGYDLHEAQDDETGVVQRASQKPGNRWAQSSVDYLA